MSKQTIIQSKYNMAGVVHLAEKEYDPQSMVKHLEEIDWEYTQYALKDTELCGLAHVAANRIFLKELMEAFRVMFEEMPEQR
jgi:hypothetical protein